MEIMPRIPLIDISCHHHDNFPKSSDNLTCLSPTPNASQRRQQFRRCSNAMRRVHDAVPKDVPPCIISPETVIVQLSAKLSAQDSLTVAGSEIKSGNLVHISNHWGSYMRRSLSSSGSSDEDVHTSNRYPVLVKVYRKRFDHYAVVSRTNRHRQMQPLYLNLNKSFVVTGPSETQFTVQLHGADGKSFIFEASNSDSAKQWMNAFENASASPILSRSPVRHSFRDRLHSGSDTDSIAEEDEDEESDKEVTHEARDNSDEDSDNVFQNLSILSSVSSCQKTLSQRGRSPEREPSTHRSPVLATREGHRQEQIQRLYSQGFRQSLESTSDLSSTLPVLDESDEL